MSETHRQAVLVVDDEQLVCDLVQTALEDAGFEVLAAGSFKAALAELERDAGNNLLGLVTDVNLGGARTGWDLAHRARELRAGIPVVYVTGDSAHEWTAKGVPQSVVITKPFALAQVVVALAGLVNQAQASDLPAQAPR
jgi:CheY-like chemotaxis protein